MAQLTTFVKICQRLLLSAEACCTLKQVNHKVDDSLNIKP